MRQWILVLGLAAASAWGQTRETLREQVRAAEIAFAKTLADRDAAAFAKYLAGEAVFVANGRAVHGAAAVAAEWKPLFAGAKAPFSWAPETVEVLESGGLALSSGPVRNAEGKRVGTFNSIWRREADGSWKVIFDNGCPVCAACGGQ